MATTSSAPPMPFDEYRLMKLRSICERYEIKLSSIAKLRQLEDFDIVVLCDDSGSMEQTLNIQMTDPFARKPTRWGELCTTVSIIVDLATALDRTGVDVFFLNRPALLGVTDASQIQNAFQQGPRGYTPIMNSMFEIEAMKADVLKERRLLLILATDGEPTDTHGNRQTSEFIDYVSKKPKTLHLSIVACTDEENSIEYLDSLIERGIPNLDVSEDFRAEKAEVLQKRGPSFPFSFGDYVVKVMLGAVDSSFGDKGLGLTADRQQTAQPVGTNQGCSCCSMS